MTVFVKDAGVWHEIPEGGGLPGIGGWAEITATTGSPTKHEYTDADGNDWTAYEWTGDGSVTTSGGLVDILMLGGGSGNSVNTGNSGGLHHGISVLPTGSSPVVVGVAGTTGAGNAGGGKSVIGPYVAHGAGLAYSVENAVGVYGEKYVGGSTDHLKGIDIDFIGTGVLPYGYALTTDRRANSGSSWDNYFASAGVVIVRVPRVNAKA